ncbi:MAG TPA: rod shape-determining protein RodA [Bacteroidia bacterium]|nr:rod shape-determining protein RodA [Bacteroidia bacterium]
MREKSDRIFYHVDWITVSIYLLLMAMGWMNIYSAVYDAKSDIFDLQRQESKQLLFAVISVMLAFVILVIDASFFTATAYILYGAIILLNIAVVFLGTEIRGSHSWFKIGGFSLQPAEFAKWATLLALAKFLSSINRPDSRKTLLTTMGIILLPMVIIMGLQSETGVALIFIAFIIVLYREGIVPGWLLLFGLLSATAFILGIKYPGTIIETDKSVDPAKVSYHFGLKSFLIWTSILLAFGLLRLLLIRRTAKQIILTFVVIGFFSGLFLAAPVALEKLPVHQTGRIKCWLGLPVPRAISDRYDYNTKQSMIAIGSGDWLGKGYLQGTQTKFRFVPEQETDFIFCTVGEEWGLAGTSLVVILYLILIMRLIIMSERQRSDFTRIYGYGVASVFFVHLIVNVGMTIGLLPVIGIPLPFFSYGGSSLISFTILLLIFVKLDSQRLLILR